MCVLLFSEFVSLRFLHQGPNGHHREQVDFVSSKEKTSKKKTRVLIGVFMGLLVLLAIAAFLIWYFVCKCESEHLPG